MEKIVRVCRGVQGCTRRLWSDRTKVGRVQEGHLLSALWQGGNFARGFEIEHSSTLKCLCVYLGLQPSLN